MRQQVVFRGVDKYFVRGAWCCKLPVPAGHKLVTDGTVAPGDRWGVVAVGSFVRRRGADGVTAVPGDWLPVMADDVGLPVSDFRAVIRPRATRGYGTADIPMCLECGRAPAVIMGRCDGCNMAVCGAEA